MKKLIFLLFVLGWLSARGSHIVGGEFELLHISGNNYQLNMILYFDVVNGNPGAFDNEVRAEIYRMRDNFHMMTVALAFQDRTRVVYTQPDCSSGELITDRIFYTRSITLTAEQFNDLGGYYISWQRCCRNYNITNIFSDPPGVGKSAGQTFYLEFPPVVKNGEAFINSSPHLFPPLSDYACPYRPYYVDFAGTDDDNDSIVYSLITPLNTTEDQALPTPSPGPYPSIEWRPGYDLQHITKGIPDMSITQNGFLTVTPEPLQGLYVFAIRVEEFRGGIKIGETRRDFQMYVTDRCAHDNPPLIIGKKLTDASFSFVDKMSIDFADTVSDKTRCIQVRVTDPQSLDPADNFSERIKIKAIGLNFKNKALNQILPTEISATLINGSEKIFTICFPQCPYLNGPYQVGIVAFDDACSLPMSDTLRITVNTEPPPNSSTYFIPPKDSIIEINEGQSASWPFTAKDDDGDDILLSVVPDGFNLNDAGMIYTSAALPGIASGSIDWNAFCKIYNFTKQTEFTIRVLADDVDKCKIIDYDTALVKFKVVLPSSHPILTIYNQDKTKDLTNTFIETNLGHMTLDIVGVDADAFPTDTLKLSLIDASGNVAPNLYTFASAKGFKTLESIFSWNTDCSIFKKGNYDNNYIFRFEFSNNHCLAPTTDTAFVRVRIKDVESNDQNFIPPNVITSNGDNCNDFFAIDGFEGAQDCNGAARSIPFTTPLDNCVNRFEQVRIYNRWGKQVFESTDRKFKWYATNESPGVYYYFMKFTRAEYKSSITVIH